MAEIDKHTATWRAVEDFLQERRDDCLQSLINGTPSDDKLRGQIRLIDDLLAHASEEPDPDVESYPDY